MRLFKTKAQSDWEGFLRTASDEELAAERWKLTKQIRSLRQKKREIQAAVDQRVLENPPEPGQVVNIGE